MKPRTAYEKIRDLHTVHAFEDGSRLIFIDRIMLHERTGPVALNGLIEDGRKIIAPERVFATIDHIVDTKEGRPDGSRMPGGKVFIDAMRETAQALGIRLFDTNDRRQGIVHVIAPEQGIALPGITMVCPDSHTCTLGGLGALAWGIGSTDCEHALVTGTLRIAPKKQTRVTISGERPSWLTAKDIAIHLIARHSAKGALDHVVDFDGPVVRGMEIDERLTLCNMAVEFGAFSAIVGPDEKTLAYMKGRAFAPSEEEWPEATGHWLALSTEGGAEFDQEIELDVSDMGAAVTWGTSPQDAVPLDMPLPRSRDGKSVERALAYMGLQGGVPLEGTRIDGAFIGSCTNSRLSDLRRAAAILEGRRVAPHVEAVCVPGSMQVKRMAEAEGIDLVFKSAGFEWQEPGCAMCFHAGGATFKGPGDGVPARVISSTNRNFEGRQGPGTRTHIASPETVALSAVEGRIADLRKLDSAPDMRAAS